MRNKIDKRSEKNINDGTDGMNRASEVNERREFELESVCRRSLVIRFLCSVYLFYMFCSCRQLFFTRYVCVFKSQWFQLYFLVTFCHFEMFISLLSTLSCCESNRTCDKNTDFSFHFSNYKYLIAIYNSLSFGPSKWREKKKWKTKKERNRSEFISKCHKKRWAFYTLETRSMHIIWILSLCWSIFHILFAYWRQSTNEGPSSKPTNSNTAKDKPQLKSSKYILLILLKITFQAQTEKQPRMHWKQTDKNSLYDKKKSVEYNGVYIILLGNFVSFCLWSVLQWTRNAQLTALIHFNVSNTHFFYRRARWR